MASEGKVKDLGLFNLEKRRLKMWDIVTALLHGKGPSKEDRDALFSIPSHDCTGNN